MSKIYEDYIKNNLKNTEILLRGKNGTFLTYNKEDKEYIYSGDGFIKTITKREANKLLNNKEAV